MSLSSSFPPDPDDDDEKKKYRAGVYSWASQLAAENRDLKAFLEGYVWPKAVTEIWHQLEHMKGGIVGLVGLQGVGKSSALIALEVRCIQKVMKREDPEKKKSQQPGVYGVVRFKWRREADLFRCLLDGTHECSRDFDRDYRVRMLGNLESCLPLLNLKEVRNHPETLNLGWGEKVLSKSSVRNLRRVVWLEMLAKQTAILIDMPDYSKTDRRLMGKDLQEIYWLWDTLPKIAGEKERNFVLAIQKEMFHDHFFFDKMIRVELDPLSPDQMVAAYKQHFKSTEPFSEEGLLTVARMSRGIFRRFLRYITMTLRLWEGNYSKLRATIDSDIVKEAVPLERLEEDMELELSELFPKHSELGKQAVRLLMHLEESGPQKQSELADQLDMETYTMSRLLGKLELYRYVTRRRDGTDKVVSLRREPSTLTSSPAKMAAQITV